MRHLIATPTGQKKKDHFKMSWKDPNKPKVKCRKLTILKERWDMFDEAKAIAEREFGKMSEGGFLEFLIVNYLQEVNYGHKPNRKTNRPSQ